ncbi:isoprenyl transferase [Longispora albida]|uniref:isoprenyl transferase n=1 Tax=Longispora albida TaxID=203523 RepID=UPI0004763CF4|nr:isoprenyl transferase [Longispora albida]
MGLRNLVYSFYEQLLTGKLAGKPRPRHVGVMVDGNRRWAKEMGYVDPNDGHRVGAAKIENLIRWCDDAGVEVVTLFLLSTENLNRPAAELDPLIRIIGDLATDLADDGNPWRLRVVGTRDVLPQILAERLKAAEERTADRTGGAQVNLAVGYGGRQEIADAVRALLQQHAEAGTSIEELAGILDVDHISEHMYTKGQPDPDLVIRTSGEQRLSGFLLWQSAYSEFYFHEANWPDFRHVDFLRALRSYADRQRRFGG